MHVVERLQDFMPRAIADDRPGMVFNLACGIQGVARYTHLTAMLDLRPRGRPVGLALGEWAVRGELPAAAGTHRDLRPTSESASSGRRSTPWWPASPQASRSPRGTSRCASVMSAEFAAVELRLSVSGCGRQATGSMSSTRMRFSSAAYRPCSVVRPVRDSRLPLSTRWQSWLTWRARLRHARLEKTAQR